MPSATINFGTFLSPVLYNTYEYIAQYVGKQLGRSATLTVGQSLEDFETIDVGFLCGLLYVKAMDRPDCPIELLAAPVLQGQRYQNRPIYYSDVVVRDDSVYNNIDDLQGCVWAYNERASHSGYNLVCYSLLERGKSSAHFSKTLATGSHMLSLKAVLEGKAHAAALDSHMLDVLRKEQPDIKIRVIDMLGPSTIPPVVVARRLDADLKRQIQNALISIHKDGYAANELSKGLIERFVPIVDENYNDIRSMLARVQQQDFIFNRIFTGLL